MTKITHPPSCCLLVFLFASLVVAPPLKADDTRLELVSLGSGAVSGIYYPVARSLCAVVNQSRREHGIRCSEEATPGSVYNLERLAAGELDFALAQSDVHYAAYKGEGSWAERPIYSLRSVMSLHPEVLTVLVPRQSPITSIAGLRGKRINIGNPGSGTRASWEDLRAALGWQPGDLAEAAELRPDAAGYALCKGEIDASLLMFGHPSALVSAELARCPQNIVPVTGEVVDQLIAERPYYSKALIVAGTYGLAVDVPSFGGRATLLTTATQREDVVYTMTKQILANIAELKKLQPALASLDPGVMARDALTAPLHPGAERAFREMGFLK